MFFFTHRVPLYAYSGRMGEACSRIVVVDGTVSEQRADGGILIFDARRGNQPAVHHLSLTRPKCIQVSHIRTI